MNERINGLWWKAQIGYNNQNCDPEVLEKFAELIVEECVMFIDTGADKFSDGDWLKTSVKDIGAMIKQHFGVEE